MLIKTKSMNGYISKLKESHDAIPLSFRYQVNNSYVPSSNNYFKLPAFRSACQFFRNGISSSEIVPDSEAASTK